MKLQSQIRAAVAAGVIVACSVGNAGAQERGGHDRQAILGVIGAALANSSSVTQEGTGNGAAIVQNGQGNTAGIRQYGRGNGATITQNGSNNAACLIQVGRGLDGAIVQNGDNQSTGLIQTRRGSREIPVEFCSTDRSGRGLALGLLRRAVRRQ